MEPIISTEVELDFLIVQKIRSLALYESMIALVCLGCSNRSVPETAWLINHGNFISALETVKSKMKAPEESMSSEGPLSHGGTFLLCPHVVEGVRELSEVSLMRQLIPFIQAPPS